MRPRLPLIGTSLRWKPTMPYRRGDIVLVPWPFSEDPTTTKKRPAVIVQNDRNNTRLSTVIIAQITSTTTTLHEPTQLLLPFNSPVGRAAGILMESVIKCENLATVHQRRVLRRIGTIEGRTLRELDTCLRVSLALA